MKRAKHVGSSHVTCPACITRAETNRFPWEPDYLSVMIRGESDYKKMHAQAVARNEKNDAMRSIGLVKVRGALGGTYWE